MRASEFIVEWQEADLYHATSIPNMLKMWHSDSIVGRGGNVSTTRNYPYALGYLKNLGGPGQVGGVIFTLNQDLLRRDIGRRRMPNTDWFKGQAPEDSIDDFKRRNDYSDTDRYETLIKGGLKSFRKYVKKIEIWLPKKRTEKPLSPGENPMDRITRWSGDDPDKYHDVSVNNELMQNNWLKDPIMRATWDAILRDPRTQVKQELAYQKKYHNVPVMTRQQYDQDHPMHGSSRAGIDEQAVAEAATQTFAGKDPMSFKSPKGGTPTMMIVTAQGSRYLITSDGMVLRNKSFHANTGGEDMGLKSWSDAIEFYNPAELPGGTTFPMAVTKAVQKGLPVALSKTRDGKRALMISDGSQWRVAKVSDIFKYVANKDDGTPYEDVTIVGTYKTTPKLGWNVLDYTLNPNNTLKSVHPGSPVTHGIRLGQHQGAAEGTVDEAKKRKRKKYHTPRNITTGWWSGYYGDNSSGGEGGGGE